MSTDYRGPFMVLRVDLVWKLFKQFWKVDLTEYDARNLLISSKHLYGKKIAIVDIGLIGIIRFKNAISILKLSSGTFAECYTEEQNFEYTQQNVFMMYECGVFAACIQLLNMEVE